MIIRAYFCFVILITSCNFSDSKVVDTQLFKKTILSLDSSAIFKDKIYIIIPSQGCSSCINPAFDFLKNYSNDNQFFFVITEIDDLKSVQSKMGNEFIGHKNILFDHKNLVGLSGFYSIHPQVFTFQKEVVSSHLHANYNNRVIWDQLATLK